MSTLEIHQEFSWAFLLWKEDHGTCWPSQSCEPILDNKLTNQNIDRPLFVLSYPENSNKIHPWEHLNYLCKASCWKMSSVYLKLWTLYLQKSFKIWTFLKGIKS
jgi:hypothetical protein